MNRVCLIGRLTKDCELRVTNNGKSVASFTLAVNRMFESADGQTADFINCVIWGKGADNLSKYCHKGSQIGVDGQLRSRSYENAQGQKVYVIEVMCDNVQFLDSKQKEQQQQEEKTTQAIGFTFNIQDDDLQF